MSQGTAYIVELAYCGLVGMRNMPDDQKHAFVYAEAPRFLFPFARRVIADATRDAGFAPLVLDPIDFGAIYLQQLQSQQGQAGAEASGEGQA
jgi:preprotein translocase subunit SecB